MGNPSDHSPETGLWEVTACAFDLGWYHCALTMPAIASPILLSTKLFGAESLSTPGG